MSIDMSDLYERIIIEKMKTLFTDFSRNICFKNGYQCFIAFMRRKIELKLKVKRSSVGIGIEFDDMQKQFFIKMNWNRFYGSKTSV